MVHPKTNALTDARVRMTLASLIRGVQGLHPNSSEVGTGMVRKVALIICSTLTCIQGSLVEPPCLIAPITGLSSSGETRAVRRDLSYGRELESAWTQVRWKCQDLLNLSRVCLLP